MILIATKTLLFALALWMSIALTSSYVKFHAQVTIKQDAQVHDLNVVSPIVLWTCFYFLHQIGGVHVS